jgi:hypothetical protein
LEEVDQRRVERAPQLDGVSWLGVECFLLAMGGCAKGNHIDREGIRATRFLGTERIKGVGCLAQFCVAVPIAKGLAQLYTEYMLNISMAWPR